MARIIDQFGRKRCQKKRKDVDYKLLLEFLQKYFVLHEQSAVENLFSTYVCYVPDGLFWLNLYRTLKPVVTRSDNAGHLGTQILEKLFNYVIKIGDKLSKFNILNYKMQPNQNFEISGATKSRNNIPSVNLANNIVEKLHLYLVL